MNIFKKIKDEHYQIKTDKLVDFEKVLNLCDECNKLGLFVDVENWKENDFKEPIFLHESNKVVGSIVMADVFYFIYGNTCISCYRNGRRNMIINVMAKTPDDEWKISIVEDNHYGTHVLIDTNTIDVYTWWDVDWLSTGKYDCDSVCKIGSWWKYIYDDVSGIYEFVAKKSMDRIFNDIYSVYSKNA